MFIDEAFSMTTESEFSLAIISALDGRENNCGEGSLFGTISSLK